MKAGQRCEALRGAGSSSGRPLQAARRLSRPQQRPNRTWRTRTSLRSPATGGSTSRRSRRRRAKHRSSRLRLSSMRRRLNTRNLTAARRCPGAGGHASCPHPCTRTSSRASSDFILFRRASNARALPPSAPADRALTIHCLCSGGPIERRRLQLAERRRRGQEACRTVAGGSTGSNATPGAHWGKHVRPVTACNRLPHGHSDRVPCRANQKKRVCRSAGEHFHVTCSPSYSVQGV